MADPIRSILIVGGGTAGWMTAAFLSRYLDAGRCTITVVESEAIGTIGVGEATVPPLAAFLRAMGIDEDDFLVQCNATYKLGIRFDGWGRETVWHPFGAIGAPQVELLPLFHHWLRFKREGREQGAYTSYSLQALLGEMSRAPRPVGGSSVVSQQGAYAFHLDAKAFAAYLSRFAVKRGVYALVDDVQNVTVDSRGFIDTVQTRKNGPLSADLFIDCSGFSGLLIEKALGDGHVDWSKHLFCDRAVVVALPVDGQLPPFTRATALDAGWAWRIPLSHRVGCGYVYSSRFTSKDEATAELLAHAGAGAETGEPAHLPMRVGRRQNFWVKNCVSVGLAAGFLEPLESTGLFLAQKGIELLLDHFPDTDFDAALAQRYNERLGTEFEQVRDFIILHYLLNGREDGDFWIENRRAAPPDSLAHALEYYDRTGLVDWDGRSLFRDASFYSLATGFGRLPRSPHGMAGQVDGERAWLAMERIKAQNLALARSLPDHGAFIRALNYKR